MVQVDNIPSAAAIGGMKSILQRKAPAWNDLKTTTTTTTTEKGKDAVSSGMLCENCESKIPYERKDSGFSKGYSSEEASSSTSSPTKRKTSGGER